MSYFIIIISVLVKKFLPDNFYQLTHVDVVRDQEFGLVQHGECLFSGTSLNDHLEMNNTT